MTRTLASGKRVLNLFSYSGAFGVYAGAGGAASITNVDVSARAIELSRENHALNGLEAEHTVGLGDARGDHDHRDVAGRSQVAADVEPVAAREHEVEHHHVEAAAAGFHERLLAVSDTNDAQALLLQVFGHEAGEPLVVLDEQNGHGSVGRGHW